MNRNEIYINYRLWYIDKDGIHPFTKEGTITAVLADGFFIIDGKKRHAFDLYGWKDDALPSLEDIIERRMDDLSELLKSTRYKLKAVLK